MTITHREVNEIAIFFYAILDYQFYHKNRLRAIFRSEKLLTELDSKCERNSDKISTGFCFITKKMI